MDTKLTVDMLVDNPKKPEWGPGKVLAIQGDEITVYFRDLPERKPGESVRTIRADYLHVAATQSDPWLDLSIKPNGTPERIRWTPNQVIDEFCKQFPGAFDDPQYHARERKYKVAAQEKMTELLGDGQLRRLLDKEDAPQLAHRLKTISHVNLLSPQESMALQDAFQNGEAVLRLAAALDDALATSQPERKTFEALIHAVNSLPAEPGRARVSTWPVLTLYPFLGRPAEYMFLKPDVTKKAAANLAFSLNYDAKLNWLTYQRLLEMSGLLMDRLRPLGARDMIDVQSFIWVTGSLGAGNY